jgi:hypothetical protein
MANFQMEWVPTVQAYPTHQKDYLPRDSLFSLWYELGHQGQSKQQNHFVLYRTHNGTQAKALSLSAHHTLCPWRWRQWGPDEEHRALLQHSLTKATCHRKHSQDKESKGEISTFLSTIVEEKLPKIILLQSMISTVINRSYLGSNNPKNQFSCYGILEHIYV